MYLNYDCYVLFLEKHSQIVLKKLDWKSFRVDHYKVLQQYYINCNFSLG